MAIIIDNKDLINAGTGYLAGRAIVNNAAFELRKYNEKIEEDLKFFANYLNEAQLSDKIGNCIISNDIDAAYGFLNNSLKHEIVHDCQNKKKFELELADLIDMRRNKYMPFYAKIQREMPDYLKNISAKELCDTMGVELISYNDLVAYHNQKEAEESRKEIKGCLGQFFCFVIIVGIIIISILSTMD